MTFIKNALLFSMKFKRYTKQQVVDFAKKNVATYDYALGERSGQYIVSVPKKSNRFKK